MPAALMEATPLSGLEKERHLAILAVVAVWKVPLGTEQCVAPRMPGTWCSGSLKVDFLSQTEKEKSLYSPVVVKKEVQKKKKTYL